MGSFYVHLESNSSFTHFQDNTISSFRNWLSTPIILEPNSYEVALVECNYPSTRARFLKGHELYKVKRVNNYLDKDEKVHHGKNNNDNIESLNNYSESAPANEWIRICTNINIESMDDLLIAMSTSDFTFKNYNGFTLLSTWTGEWTSFDFEFDTEMAAITGFQPKIYTNAILQSDYKFDFKSNSSLPISK